MAKLKINLYGESWKLKKLEIEVDLKILIMKLCNELGLNIGSALLDLSFYENLQLSDIQSYSDLSYSEIGGLLNSNKSQIEIWFSGKRVKKMTLESLFRENTLFTLFRSTETYLDEKDLEPGIYLIDKEIGLVACYELEIPHIQIDDFSFGLLKFSLNNQMVEVLNAISYKDGILNSKRSDLLLNQSLGFVVE